MAGQVGNDSDELSVYGVMEEATASAADDTLVEWPAELVSLYRESYVRFVRLAYLLTGRRDVAEELTQDAFIATAGRWPLVSNADGYVRAAVVNRCRSWFRRAAVERRHSSVPPDRVDMEPDELWDVVLRLPERRRAAIVLRFYEDRSDEDIAQILGCRPGTVRTLIHRGLAQLRKEIDR